MLLAAVAAWLLLASGDETSRDARPHSPAPPAVDPLAALRGGTVRVTTHLNGERTNSGSGFVLDERRGLVVTAAHVLNYQPDAGRLAVRLHARGWRRRAAVVAVAPCQDVAVLRARLPASTGAIALAAPDRKSVV